MYVESEPSAGIGQFAAHSKENRRLTASTTWKFLSLKKGDFPRKPMLGMADHIDSTPRDKGAGLPTTGINRDYIPRHTHLTPGTKGAKIPEHTSGSLTSARIVRCH